MSLKRPVWKVSMVVFLHKQVGCCLIRRGICQMFYRSKIINFVIFPSKRVNRNYFLAKNWEYRMFYSSIFATCIFSRKHDLAQGCIFRLTCSHPKLIEDHVLTSAYVKICRTVTKNAVNESVWRKKYCSWLPLNKHAMNIWLSSLRIRAHLSWRTGKHLHVLHVLRTYSTCSYPG